VDGAAARETFILNGSCFWNEVLRCAAFCLFVLQTHTHSPFWNDAFFYSVSGVYKDGKMEFKRAFFQENLGHGLSFRVRFVFVKMYVKNAAPKTR
jgi:hypothetical protein